MVLPVSSRCLIPLALAALCCSCTTPEERADAAFGELCALAEQLRGELAAVVNRETADEAAPRLEKLADGLRETLTRLDELAAEPGLEAEARRRVGQQHHAALRAAVDAVLEECHRVVAQRALYQSKPLKRLARREFAHYSTKGIHPWPRAVYAGREYRPKARK